MPLQIVNLSLDGDKGIPGTGTVVGVFAGMDVPELQNGSVQLEVLLDDLPVAALNLSFNAQGLGQAKQSGGGGAAVTAGQRVRSRCSVASAGAKVSKLQHALIVNVPA